MSFVWLGGSSTGGLWAPGTSHKTSDQSHLIINSDEIKDSKNYSPQTLSRHLALNKDTKGILTLDTAVLFQARVWLSRYVCTMPEPIWTIPKPTSSSGAGHSTEWSH